MELTKEKKKKLKYTSDVIRLDKKHLDKSIKEYVRVLKSEMNILGERIIDKDEKTGNRRGNLHTALWVLKDRIDEIEGRIDERKRPNSSDTKVSK